MKDREADNYGKIQNPSQKIILNKINRKNQLSTISGTEFGSNLEFWTHPDAIGSISAKRMEIDKNGMLTVYTVDTGDAVTVNGTIVATSNVTTNTGNMYALEGSFISTKSEVSGVPLFGNFQAYQTID